MELDWSRFWLVLLEEVRRMWWVFGLGVLVAALIKTFKWDKRIRKRLQGRPHGAIALATGVGLISPLCSCGVVPLVISLIYGGVPLAPVVALLEPFDADAYGEARRVLATLDGYSFLAHGEQRDGIFGHGPYPGPDGTVLFAATTESGSTGLVNLYRIRPEDVQSGPLPFSALLPCASFTVPNNGGGRVVV